MERMSDDRFEALLRDLARSYNAPPSTPREAMWARIHAERRARAARHAARRRRARYWWAAVGLAAALLLGVTIGRLTVRQTTPGGSDVATRGPAPSEPAPTRSGAPRPYQLAAVAHLTQAEALLTTLHSEARGGQVDTSVTRWARDLLSTTRLMLDSPAANDRQLRGLLEDLELVLVQITQLKGGHDAQDLDYIDQAVRQRDVLTRLRQTTPAEASRAGT
jgi:hypothetical protein